MESTGFIKTVGALARIAFGAMLAITVIFGGLGIYGFVTGDHVLSYSIEVDVEIDPVIADAAVATNGGDASGSGLGTLRGPLGVDPDTAPRSFVAWMLVTVLVGIGGAVVILYQLIRLLTAAGQAKPFRDDSWRRVRAIGGVVIAMELLGSFFAALAGSSVVLNTTNLTAFTSGPGLDLGPIFTGLLIFVLAEVFRHGHRLQVEQELTV